jgi:hypothetical protein
MKKVLFKLAPFVLLTFIFIVVRNYYVDERYLLPQPHEKEINNAVILLGDSKNCADFNDAILDNFSSKTFYNLSFWGASPANIKKMVENIKIKNSKIFLNISSRVYISQGFSDEKYRIKEIFYGNVGRTFLLNITKKGTGKWEYESTKFGSTYFKNLKCPYSPYNRKLDSGITISNYKYDSTNNRYNTVTKGMLVDLLQHLSKNNNEVFLIDLPERICFNQWIGNAETELFKRVDSLSKNKIVDFGNYPDSLFYDSHHLNRLGTVRFTNEFIQKFGNVIK